MDVRFQINWMDKDGVFLDTSISIYSLTPGQRLQSVSDPITPPEGAVTGILYLGPHATGTHLTAYGYQLSQISGQNYATGIDDFIHNRSYLTR